MMEDLPIKRLDHHGLVMGVIKDLNLIQEIDNRVERFEDEKTSVGERVAALILNGLGFTDQPLSLVADFFEELPIDTLFGRAMEANAFDRFSLSRALDRISSYGESQLFAEVASVACTKEVIDLSRQSVDTTSFSVTGEDYDEEACKIKLTHGYSKDHRPDLKQIVTELLVSHDAGIPLIMKNWSGNESDTKIFKERTKNLVASFKKGYGKIIVADSKFYTKDNAQYWDQIQFITRAPESIKSVKEAISKAVKKNDWQPSKKEIHYQAVSVNHYDTDQVWVICRSEQSDIRAKKSLEKSVKKEKSIIDKSLYHFQSECFSCKKDAEKQLSNLTKKWRYHNLSETLFETKNHYEKPGKPSKTDTPANTTYRVQVTYRADPEKITELTQIKSCFLLATNIPKEDISPEEIIQGYKDQQTVERGYRFLKDPHFFTSALFLKKPSRISVLIMVMTLSLLVYSIAQRRLRNSLIEQQETLPDQTKNPTQRITMRWAFRLLRGINLVWDNSTDQWVVNSMTDLKKKVIKLVAGFALNLYQIAPTCRNEITLDTG